MTFFNPFDSSSKAGHRIPEHTTWCGPFLAGGGRCTDLLLWSQRDKCFVSILNNFKSPTNITCALTVVSKIIVCTTYIQILIGYLFFFSKCSWYISILYLWMTRWCNSNLFSFFLLSKLDIYNFIVFKPLSNSF